MTGYRDDQDMGSTGHETAEHALLADLLEALRASADEAPPAPTPALAEVLRTGLPHPPSDRSDAARRATARRWPRTSIRLAAAGLGAKIALGAGVATAVVAGTAVVEGPTGPVHRGFDAVASVVGALFHPAEAPPTTNSVETGNGRGPGTPVEGGSTSGVPAPRATAPAEVGTPNRGPSAGPPEPAAGHRGATSPSPAGALPERPPRAAVEPARPHTPEADAAIPAAESDAPTSRDERQAPAPPPAASTPAPAPASTPAAATDRDGGTPPTQGERATPIRGSN
jgi:hypothetical protein